MTGILLVLLYVALVGFIVYLITENIPMPPAFKQVIIVIAVVLLILWVMGLLSGKLALPTIPQFG